MNGGKVKKSLYLGLRTIGNQENMMEKRIGGLVDIPQGTMCALRKSLVLSESCKGRGKVWI